MLRALTALLLSILLALCAPESGQEANADRPRTTAIPTPPRFEYQGLERPLRLISWDVLGHDLALLQPLLGREAERQEGREKGLRHGGCGGATESAGVTLSSGSVSSGSLRRTVRAQINRLAGSGLTGTGPHGVFTHPAVLVNAIHFTLRGADQPLTKSQAEELYHLGQQFVDEERSRVRGARNEPLALVRLLEESELRARFVVWAAATLTLRQQSVLLPDSTVDLVGWNYFSGGAVLAPQAHPIAYMDKAQLVDGLLRWHVGRFGFGERELPIVRSHIERFVKGLPAEPAIHQRGVLSVKYTNAVAGKTAALHRALLAERELSWSQRDRLRREQRFCVPVRIAAPTVGD